MNKETSHRSPELKKLGWNQEDITRYEELWDYSQRWGLINLEKEDRVRMAPTIIIFKDGIAEESFKAGLDLECPVDLDELQEAIKEVKEANAF